jgi:hypothetical protein
MTNTWITTARAALMAALIGACAVAVAATANATPTAGNAPAVGGLFGDPSAAGAYWRYQTYDDCAEMAVADVIGQLTRSEPSEPDIIAAAHTTPSTVHPGPMYRLPPDLNNPNSGQGTDGRDLPALLARYRIDAAFTDQHSATRTGLATGMAALEHNLATGHKIIAYVNAETLWGQPGQRTQADHYLVVTAVDTATNTVHLNDSGTPTGRDEKVSIPKFEQIWGTGDDFMIIA